MNAPPAPPLPLHSSYSGNKMRIPYASTFGTWWECVKLEVAVTKTNIVVFITIWLVCDDYGTSGPTQAYSSSTHQLWCWSSCISIRQADLMHLHVHASVARTIWPLVCYHLRINLVLLFSLRTCAMSLLKIIIFLFVFMPQSPSCLWCMFALWLYVCQGV